MNTPEISVSQYNWLKSYGSADGDHRSWLTVIESREGFERVRDNAGNTYKAIISGDSVRLIIETVGKRKKPDNNSELFGGETYTKTEAVRQGKLL